MRLSIRHTTHYRFAEPVAHGLQRLRLTPKATQGQEVLDWQMRFEGLAADNSFMLAAGERRKLVIELVPGTPFTPDDVRADAQRDIAVEVQAAGMPLGGMLYRLDPDKKGLPPGAQPSGQDCKDKAAALLDCLNLGGGKVAQVCVKKVSLDIKLDNDCDCQ